jgi:hypothetical protein
MNAQHTVTDATPIATVAPITHVEARPLAEAAYAAFADAVERLGTDDWAKPTDRRRVDARADEPADRDQAAG